MTRRAKATVGFIAVVIALWAPSAAFAASGANPVLTPGATNPAVTQGTIATTICTVGYTKTVRNVSNATKSQVYAAYGIPQSQKRLYVIDHLIPLEVGGANTATNLWPELKADAKAKDRAEGDYHARVCSGAVDLATAQQAFRAVWASGSTTALPPPATAAPPTAAPPTAAPLTAAPATEAPVAPGGGATARCNDGTYSYAAHHQGACSSHGGVATFYK